MAFLLEAVQEEPRRSSALIGIIKLAGVHSPLLPAVDGALRLLDEIFLQQQMQIAKDKQPPDLRDTKYKYDAGEFGPLGRTVLHVIATRCAREAADAGDSLESKARFKWAISELERVLRSCKDDIDIVDWRGYTPLDCALSASGGVPLEAIEHLTNANAKLSQLKESALRRLLMEEKMSDSQSIKVIKMLKKGGADLNATDHNHLTLLHHMVKGRRDEVVRVLLKCEVKDKKDKNGLSALDYAETIEMRSILEKHGVRSGKKTTSDLVLAISQRQDNRVEEHLATPVDPNSRGLTVTLESGDKRLGPLPLDVAMHGDLNYGITLLKGRREW